VAKRFRSTALPDIMNSTIEPEIHRRMINLFGKIIRNFEPIERDIAIRQLATKPKTSDSWFIEIVKLNLRVQ
jgi:hypothetical protein